MAERSWTSGRFPWAEHARRFPGFNEPDASYHGLVYAERFGARAYIERARSVYQRTMGAVLSPFNAFLLLQGIETVALRVERHVENARKVAEFLRRDPRVDWVNYAGFPDSPYYALVQKYLNGNASSLFTFGIKGGLEAGKTFYDQLKLITRLVNYRRREIARLPSRLDHPPPDVCGTAAHGRRPAGNHPAFNRHRTRHRHHRGYRPGPGDSFLAAQAA